MQGIVSVFWNAAIRLVYDGGLANAGNIALSLLLSLFPFTILIAAFANIWGDPELLEEILTLLFDHWPAGSAGPIAEQVNVVLSQASGELLTFGNLVALILATNGIESARDGLNRAYRFTEDRNFLLRRLQGCLFVTVGALTLILAAFILVATPIAWSFLISQLPWLVQFSFTVGLVQYAVAALLLVSALLGFHYFLPSGNLRFPDLIWGVLMTILAIVAGSEAFSVYLKNFANYGNLYAGLAGVMIVIVYLYCLSVLILFGAEFNAALMEYRKNRSRDM